MKRSLFCASLLACSLALSLGGCACCNEKTESEEKCNTATAKAMPGTSLSPAGTVNLYCVVNPNDAIEADSATTEWKGEKVGFCCGGCVSKWNKMTDAQKDAKIAAAKARNAAATK